MNSPFHLGDLSHAIIYAIHAVLVRQQLGVSDFILIGMFNDIDLVPVFPLTSPEQSLIRLLPVVPLACWLTERLVGLSNMSALLL